MKQESLRKLFSLNYDKFRKVMKGLGHIHESYVDEKFEEFTRDRARFMVNIDEDTFDAFMREIGEA